VDAGTQRPDSLNAGYEMSRTSIAKVVTIDRGDDHVTQAHVANGPGQAFRLRRIRRLGPTVRHVAEGTSARADFTQNHERCRALGKALMDIRTGGFLADGHQPIGAQP
jgi:hypothetical protein